MFKLWRLHWTEGALGHCLMEIIMKLTVDGAGVGESKAPERK
jgi:hypothetical protein